ncbi:MAG: transglutaminase-like domain-containing protein [Candidatus Micrarchaeia archaeon]
MRRLFIILLLSGLALANSFGYSRLSIERTWTIQSDGSDYDLTASIGINNSNQRIVSVITDPQAEVTTDPDGVVWVHFQGSGENRTVLRADSVVDIDYDTNITADHPVPGGRLESSNLTEPDQAIRAQAGMLGREDSSLASIANLVNWVHSNVTYDISYWGRVRAARDVITERRGVCVEYTHLLISMARSLGFDTRYVSGYVFANAWQAHAWAEIYIPGYGWLPADPTFGQVGILDDTHFGMHYGPDQSGTYDILLSKDKDAQISVDDRLALRFATPDSKGVNVTVSVDRDSHVADVAIRNDRPEYVFGSYSFQVPDGYGGEQSSILLLRPSSVVHKYQGINQSLFQNRFLYDLPMTASFNDAKDEKVLGSDGVSDGAQKPGASSPCLPGFLLIGLALARIGRP